MTSVATEKSTTKLNFLYSIDSNSNSNNIISADTHALPRMFRLSTTFTHTNWMIDLLPLKSHKTNRTTKWSLLHRSKRPFIHPFNSIRSWSINKFKKSDLNTNLCDLDCSSTLFATITTNQQYGTVGEKNILIWSWKLRIWQDIIAMTTVSPQSPWIAI